MPAASSLPVNERAMLAILEACAEAGDPCPSNEDLAEALEFDSVAAPCGVLKRLERRGYISVTRYQRSRAVTICATGISTRKPPNTRTHWREDTERLPTPGIPALRERHPDTFTMIQSAAVERGCSISEFLCDLVHAGWRARSSERAF